MSTAEQPTTSAALPGAIAGLTSAIERAVLERLRYGLFWIIAAAGWFVTLSLALVQSQRPEAFQEHPLAPVARVLLVVEGAMFLTALLMARLASEPATAGRQGSGHLAGALAGGLIVLLQFALQLTPLLVVYRAPELLAKGIHVPLMMLQRGVLLCLCVLIAYHLLLALRLQLRLPLAAAFGATLALYMWGTYSLVKLSLASSTFKQLNDVFYWNQLSLHIDTLPALYTERIVDRIEPQYLGYYLALGLFCCVATLLLWIPAAVKTDARETRSALSGTPSRKTGQT